MKQWRIAIENNSNLRQENEKLKLALEKKGLEIKKINLAAKRNVSEIGTLKTKVSNLEDLVRQLQSDLDKAQKKASENEKQSINAKFIRELDEINDLVSKHGQRKLAENRAIGSVSLPKIPRIAASPVCRGKLTDTRNFALENVLEQLPKIKCKYSGCTFQKSDAQQVKIHEEECREKRVFCELCWMGIAMSKLFSHLETKHRMKPYGSKTSLGQEFWIRTLTKGRGFIPLSKVNDFEFIVNRKSCGEEGIVMFWISLNGSAKEANQYEYTLKLWNKDITKILALKSTKCLSVDMWRGNKAMALLLSRDDEKKAENNKELWLTLLIKKK